MSNDDKDTIVQIGDETPVLVDLPDNCLSEIRKVLSEKNVVSMDDELLFAKKVNSMFAIITKDDEKNRTLKSIKDDKVLYLRYINEEIYIYINESQPVSARLNLDNNLSKIRSKIRQVLKKKLIPVNIADTLVFVNKYEDTVAKIEIEEEDNIILRYIIKHENGKKNLYLEKDSEMGGRFLSNKYQLYYGINDEFEKAKKYAFKIMSCEMEEINCKENVIEVDSGEDLNVKEGWGLTADDVIRQNFAKLGVPIGNLKIKNSTNKNYSTRKIIEHKKVSLTFTLKPTTKFIKAVEDAVAFKDLSKLKDVTNKFGQFISSKVIFGGKAYFEESNENVSGGAINASATTSEPDNKRRSGFNFYLLRGNDKKKSSKYKVIKLFGGEPLSSEDFNVTEWAKSLDDFKKWVCIGIDPISIFKLLSDELQEGILALLGKKIHYSFISPFCFDLIESDQPEKPGKFEFVIPDYISINDKKADYSIFAAVVDTEDVENDVFNCKILWPQDGNPELIVHCIQKEFKERKCNLKIRWMIIGNNIHFNFNSPDSDYKLEVKKIDFNELNIQKKLLDIESSSPSSLCFGIPVQRELDDSLAIGHHFFNNEEKTKSFIFSYSLKEKHYVNLPKFTFHVLIIIPDNRDSDYGITDSKFINKFRIFDKTNPLRYISPYFKGVKNHYPIFLKQKGSEIKMEYIDVKCDQKDCICKVKPSDNIFTYAFFDPKYESSYT